MSRGSAAGPQCPLLKHNQPGPCFPQGLSPHPGAHHFLNSHLKVPALKPSISQTALSNILSNTPSLYWHRPCLHFVPKAPGMSQHLHFALGSQELSWQPLCPWPETALGGIPPRSAVTHGSTGPERRTRLYYIHSSGRVGQSPRRHGEKRMLRPRQRGEVQRREGGSGRCSGRCSGRGGLVGVVHVVHVALLVLRHLRQSPLSPPGRAGPRADSATWCPPPAPPSPPSTRRPRNSSRPPRPPRWAASGCPLQGQGQGDGEGCPAGGMPRRRDEAGPPKGASPALAQWSMLSPRDVSGGGDQHTDALPVSPAGWLSPPLSVLPSGLPTMAPPINAISRDTIMPAAWNPPWTLGVRVWYTPVKSNALMNLPRAETVMIVPGWGHSLAPGEPCCPALLGNLP